MRKNFVYFVLVPTVILGIVVYLYLNSWIESGLEYAGEQLVGAKVEIDNFKLTINPLGGEFSRLQVTDPHNGWKNLFEVGKAKFALDLGQLLRGKYIVETMEINELILGTQRLSDGSIPKKQDELPESKFTSTSIGATSPSESLPSTALAEEHRKRSQVSFDIEKIKRDLRYDSLLNPANLYTLRYLDTLRQEARALDSLWNTTVAEFQGIRKKLTDIEVSIKSIDVNAIQDIQTATETLTKIRTAVAEVKEIQEAVSKRRQAVIQTVNEFNTSLNAIDDIVKNDYVRVVQAAKLPDLSLKGLSELFFGDEIFTEAIKYLKYAEKARTILQNTSSTPAMEKPQRMRGQTIHFPAERSYPKFWIKKIVISGGTARHQNPNYFYAKGEVRNITNDQRITGVPLTVDLFATRGSIVSLSMKFLFDRTKNLPYDYYNVRITGIPIATMKLGSPNFLPSKVSNARMDADVTVEIPHRGFDARATMQINNINIIFERAPTTVVERIVQEVVMPLKGFSTLFRMWKVDNQFKVAFETDLDNQLMARTKQVIGAELAKIQNEIKKNIDDLLAGKKKEIEKLYTEKRDMLLVMVREYEMMVEDKLAFVESKKKELEQRIESEKTKRTEDVKKKAGEALKKLLK
ncbi:MAG: TIGR03545 family protein [Bacteroidetes bacterium]|nr:TIGR03545 family protein [Bacteroidota bacterium]